MMSTSSDLVLFDQIPKIMSPLAGATVCTTVCVCGQLITNFTKDDKSNNNASLDEIVKISGGGKGCNATLHPTLGTFCCELVDMAEGDWRIQAEYTYGKITTKDSINVTVDSEYCNVTFLTPACGGGGSGAITIQAPEVAFKDVPADAQCRLSVKELPDGDFVELQTLAAPSHQSVTYDTPKLDPTMMHMFQAELLDTNDKVINTVTAMHSPTADSGS